MEIKQAVILSAGLGTRMRSLTDHAPKVMVPVLGKPLLLRNIEQFKKYGVREFFINLHYLPEAIKNYFGNGSKFGVKITYNFEPEILGTAGGVKGFENELGDEFFLLYGDTLSLLDYQKMEVMWRNMPASAIGMQRVGKSGNYADVDVAELGDGGKVLAIHSKPHAREYSGAYRLRGIFIMSKKILSFVPENTYYEIGKDLLPDIINKGELFYGYECDDYSKGIDTPEKLKEAEAYLRAE